MTLTEPPVARPGGAEEPFYFAERRARSFSTAVMFVILGGFIVAPPIVGIFWPDSLFNPRFDFHYFGIQLMLLGGLSILALLPAVIRNRVKEVVVDRAGIRYGGRSWTWDEIRWIGSTEHNLGGVWLAFRAKDKPDREVRLVPGLGGSGALSPAQFEQIVNRIEGWTLVHAPHVTIERTRSASDRKKGKKWAVVSFTVAAALAAWLVIVLVNPTVRAALNNFRHPVALRVLFILGPLVAVSDGIREWRGKKRKSG